MPLVRIDLLQGKPAHYRKSIGDIVHRAMVEVINVPHDDRFQIIAEHPSENFNVTPAYLGIRYSPDIVFVQITLNHGRTVAQKRVFYRRVADDLNRELGIDRQNVFINLVEVPKENWSFGNGEAQYAPDQADGDRAGLRAGGGKD